jgi:hypothetical protein
MHRRLAALAVILIAAGCATCTAVAETPAPEVNLLAMGDWGRGSPLQKTVATSMADYVSSVNEPFAACLLAGDNFYVPLASTKDPNWQRVFEKMYDPKTLDFPFYATFGNHDYQNPKDVPAAKNEIELAYAKEHPESRWKFPALWYRVDLPNKDHPLVSVLMLNSNKPFLTPAQWDEQLAFIDHELADRRGATWMIACAHHPLFSNGAHGDNGVLQTTWGRLFQEHHLDFYVAGHDHDLQQLQLPNLTTTFLMVGGGGATTRPMLRDSRGPFSDPHVGFTHLRLTPTLATVTYVNGLDGTILHQFTRTSDGALHVTHAGPVVHATTKPLQTIQGLDQKKKKAVDD